MGLLGDQGVELLLGDDTIAVQICSFDHLLEGIVVGELSEIFGDFPQILEGDETCINSDLPVFWASKVINTLWT